MVASCISMWFTSCTLEHGTHCVVHWHLHSVLYLIDVEAMPNWMLECVQWSLPYTGKGDKRSGHFTVSALHVTSVFPCFIIPVDTKPERTSPFIPCWIHERWEWQIVSLLACHYLQTCVEYEEQPASLWSPVPMLTCVRSSIHLVLCPLAPTGAEAVWEPHRRSPQTHTEW